MWSWMCWHGTDTPHTDALYFSTKRIVQQAKAIFESAIMEHYGYSTAETSSLIGSNTIMNQGFYRKY